MKGTSIRTGSGQVRGRATSACSCQSDAGVCGFKSVRAALDADTANDRAALLRSVSRELGPTRDAVIDAVMQRLDLSQKQAAEASGAL